MPLEQIAVVAQEPCWEEKAWEISKILNIPWQVQAVHQLLVGAEGLYLKRGDLPPVKPDFRWETWKKRRQEGKKQGIVRACKPRGGMHILDVTAGWGRDAALLASFGARVVMVERNPIMALLLKDALARRDPLSQKALDLSLVEADAKFYLSSLQSTPDLIYIDPMHPVRKKNALVKKELQMLQTLLGSDADAKDVLALAKTKSKVVVKWPQRLLSLCLAQHSIEGKTVRFDIYLK